jgi:hypothetical protein
MAPRRPAVSTTVATFALVVVLIVGAVGLSSLDYRAQGGPVTYSANSSSGLQIKIKLSTTHIVTGSTFLTAQVVLFNPLHQNLSVTAVRVSNSTISTWNSYDYPWGINPTSSIAGYALFRGHYASGNLSSAGEPLTLIPPIPYLCPNFISEQLRLPS